MFQGSTRLPKLAQSSEFQSKLLPLQKHHRLSTSMYMYVPDNQTVLHYNNISSSVSLKSLLYFTRKTWLLLGRRLQKVSRFIGGSVYLHHYCTGRGMLFSSSASKKHCVLGWLWRTTWLELMGSLLGSTPVLEILTRQMTYSKTAEPYPTLLDWI